MTKLTAIICRWLLPICCGDPLSWCYAGIDRRFEQREREREEETSRRANEQSLEKCISNWINIIVLIFVNVLRSHLLSAPLSAIWFSRFFKSFFSVVVVLLAYIFSGCYNSPLHYGAHNQRFHPWRRWRWWWLQNWKLLCRNLRSARDISSFSVETLLFRFYRWWWLCSLHFISFLLLISISGFIHQLFLSLPLSHFAGTGTHTRSVWLQFVIVIG